MANMPSTLLPRASSFCRGAMRQQAQRKAAKQLANRTLTTTAPTTTAPTTPKHYARSPCRAHTPVFLPTKPTSIRPSIRRTYHSYDHPSPPKPFSPTERTILTAAYAHVPAHGFSHEALALGARDAGFLDISTNLLPDGLFSLVQWHLVAQREALAGRAQALFSGKERMAVGWKLEAMVWARLMGNSEVIRRWQEALAIMAQPSYVPESLKELAQLSDEIWFLVGDTAVDMSWYTKRVSLSAVYASTELYMTNDRTEGFLETKKFLRRRLEEVQGVGGTLRSMGQWIGFTGSAGLNVLRSKGMRI